ncbi:MAG: FixH family protein [Bacteroidia bacterium]|nr:FixH family protein [Bacteroidia bacterium]
MNWGVKITVLYLGFVALILTLAFTCFGQKVELESKDYYAKELKFQNQIDASGNANSLTQPIEHQVIGRSVELNLPKEILNADLKGSINFLRPSDSSKDKLFELRPDSSGKQVLSDNTFIKGVYKMQISFVSNGKSYYKEDVVFLQ